MQNNAPLKRVEPNPINNINGSFELHNGTRKNNDGTGRRNKYVDHVQRNKNSEDEVLEFYGFKQNNVRTVLTWISYILSVGLLRLFYHWFPKFQLYSTHDRCTLNSAEKILIIEIYREKSKAYFVKTVKMIASEADSCEKLNYDLENGSNKECSKLRLFSFKKVSYVWDEEKSIFLKLSGMEIGKTNMDFHKMEGLQDNQQNSKLKIYGNNKIDVPQYSTLKLFALEALTPFYIFQVFSLIVWMAEYYYYYGVAIVVMSVYGIGSSVHQTRKNQQNLKGTVNKSDVVNVKRNAQFLEVSTTSLVPGDIIEIPANGCCQMYCDAILLNGSCIVNESSLTGESVPVLKNALPKTDAIFDISENGNHVLYCGTAIIQTRYYGMTQRILYNEHINRTAYISQRFDIISTGADKVSAVVLRTGWLTTKGELVKSIMYPPPADFKFDQDSYKYILILAVVSMLGVVYTIVSKSARGLSAYDVIIKALDLITIVIPPALPAAMTVGKLFALKRLEKLRIYCINSRVVNVSGSIDCVCFDKTGTLTEDGLDMWGVIPVNNQQLLEPQMKVDRLAIDGCELLMGMVTCHSLTLIEGKLEGDPLDLKMFESTQWILEEPDVPDTTKYDLFVPTIVKPSQNDDLEIGILRQFQFSSTLQRMSVISKRLNSNNFCVYCKGSPEMIISLSLPETVPMNIFTELEKYTRKGYRVIAIAGKKLPEDANIVKIQRVVREDVENNLEFFGLIILENRLKKETTATIQVLKEAEIKIIMITGDNIQTAVSVAKECGIITKEKDLVFVNLDERSKTPCANYKIVRRQQNMNISATSATDLLSLTTSTSSSSEHDAVDSQHQHVEYQAPAQHNAQVAMTGITWAHLKELYTEEERRTIIRRGVVFARMTSDQKQQLVQELQAIGHYVAMCGDGTNDCSALKAAHVGISLSEAESSIASPFTAQQPNIACVPNVVTEGRAALVTSYGIFKFMICYSLVEFISCIILYGMDSNLTSFQFLYIDLLLIVHFTATFGMTGSCAGTKLSKQRPMAALLSVVPLTSIALQLVCVTAFQTTAYFVMQTYNWYRPFTYVPDSLNYKCFENYAVFTVSMFQYIILAVIFSKGKPFRQPIYTNKFLTASILIMTAVCLYIALAPAIWISDILELQLPPAYDGKLMVLGLALVHCVLAWTLEDALVEIVLQRKVLPFVRRKLKKTDKVQDGELNLNDNHVAYANLSFESDSQL